MQTFFIVLRKTIVHGTILNLFSLLQIFLFYIHKERSGNNVRDKYE